MRLLAEMMLTCPIRNPYHVPDKAFLCLCPPRRLLMPCQGDNHIKPTKIKEAFISRQQQQNSNFSGCSRQDTHVVYKSQETQGKHSTSLVITQTPVKYHFPFIISAKFFFSKISSTQSTSNRNTHLTGETVTRNVDPVLTR